jgi:hypothetical protein
VDAAELTPGGVGLRRQAPGNESDHGLARSQSWDACPDLIPQPYLLGRTGARQVIRSRHAENAVARLHFRVPSRARRSK